MGLFDIFGGKKKSSSPEPYTPPPYVPSQYDAGSSSAIYGFYEPRVRGENLGFSKEDLGTMESQAQDHSTRMMNEAIRRGASGRRAGTGGTWTGGRDTMRDEAIRGGLEYRSNAVRDIAVRNAVLKHQDQWNAASGLGNFLGNERAHALAKWSGNTQGAQTAYQYNRLYPMLMDQESNLFNRAAGYGASSDMAQIALNLFNRYQASQEGSGGSYDPSTGAFIPKFKTNAGA